MKKISIVTLFLAAMVASGAYAASNYSMLTGNWDGKIVTNAKDATGGGSPTMGETGTPVTISFTSKGTGVTGTTVIGKDKEEWQIDKDEYTWSDSSMTVSTKAIGYADVPAWVRKQANLKPADTFFAFKFAKCTINKTQSACEAKKDLPDGLDKTGIWLFKVENDKLQFSVYYNYTNGGKRILEQSLAKKK